MMFQHRKHRFDFPLQGSYHKGFCNIIYCTNLISPYLVALLIVGSQKNHNCVRAVRLYEFAQIKAAAIREIDIQQYQIKFPLANSFSSGSVIQGRSHAVTVCGQIIGQHLIQKAVILNNQNLLHILTSFASTV